MRRHGQAQLGSREKLSDGLSRLLCLADDISQLNLAQGQRALNSGRCHRNVFAVGSSWCGPTDFRQKAHLTRNRIDDNSARSRPESQNAVVPWCLETNWHVEGHELCREQMGAVCRPGHHRPRQCESVRTKSRGCIQGGEEF